MVIFNNEKDAFPISHDEVLYRVSQIDPIAYGRSRNFIDGAVTYLSPYISRGVISTKQVLKSVLERGYTPSQIEKFIQELAWRDYWQQIWITKGSAIDLDLKNTQSPVSNHGIQKAILNASTGIDAIDTAIKSFYKTGYLHNHVRMYIASICCNIGQSHWSQPAKWMYYHLIDSDWASNALSWQWVAGTNSNKKYVANQTNINTYCHSKQTDTFLDIDYSEFAGLEVPEVLKTTIVEDLTTPLPENDVLKIDSSLPTYIYNYYNLDPNWGQEIEANRILLLEPSVFKKYPVSKKNIDFILALSKNIDGIQNYIGEFDELIGSYSLNTMYYKEHPLNSKYRGIEIPRDWMFDVTGYFPSFFRFWKKCKKQLQY